MTLRLFDRAPGEGIMKDVSEAKKRILDALSAGRPFWLDLEAPTDEEVEILREVFRFHPLAIEDCLYRLQRPKVDEYPGYLFIVLHSVSSEVRGQTAAGDGPGRVGGARVAGGSGERRPTAGPGAVSVRGKDTGRRLANRWEAGPGLFVPLETDVFVSEKFLVTFHWDRIPSLEQIYADLLACHSAPGSLRSTGYLLQRIMRVLVDDFFPVLDRVEDHLEDIERRIFQRPSQELLAQAFSLRRTIIRIRKSLSPEREVLNALLRRDQPFMTGDDRAYFLDVYDHILRLFDHVDNLHDLLSNALDAYLSSMSNRLNEIMKVLTMISTIMMPLSLVAGIYGMNFAYMPELHWKFGYPFALLIMAVITGVMVWYFKRKGWI
ncbi:MAG: magnesium/cobalt transporter CorA [Firmicutes bacterium]|nr:magnesium/cobalt transporter CorA [Candidatus Fermentithermobacillaceae bacterium]